MTSNPVFSAARTSVAVILAAALLAGCMGGGPAVRSSATGTQVNDPGFSGVTDTSALDDSYTPEGGL